jgi:tRNA(Ile)-lysidine synthetase-like protein
MTALESVADFIQAQALFDPGEPVVVGVSGGADSLCLMEILLRLGYPLVVAHFDHGLRPESAGEAEHVRQLAERADLDFDLERGDAEAARTTSGGSLEAVARHMRYRFLLRVAIERGSQRVATGHTADDQVETVLMNLLNGAGPDGLRGMSPLAAIGRWPEFGPGIESSVQLARPLLALSRIDTEAYCEERGLEPLVDPSNLDRRFLRNRVRHELLGILESYNPEIRQSLLRTGLIMGPVADLLDREVDGAWEGCIRRMGGRALGLSGVLFGAQPVAIQRRLLRRALVDVSVPLRDAGFETVERLRQAILAGNPTRISLPGGLALERVGAEWLLGDLGTDAAFPAYPLLVAGSNPRVIEEGSQALACGWRLCVERRAVQAPPVLTPRDSNTAMFDADELTYPLILRSPRPGDRLAPLGLSGTIKLSDLFINHQVPRRLRGRWPVVVAGDAIAWVAGLRRGSLAPIGPSTRNVIQMQLASPESDLGGSEPD